MKYEQLKKRQEIRESVTVSLFFCGANVYSKDVKSYIDRCVNYYDNTGDFETEVSFKLQKDANLGEYIRFFMKNKTRRVEAYELIKLLKYNLIKFVLKDINMNYLKEEYLNNSEIIFNILYDMVDISDMKKPYKISSTSKYEIDYNKIKNYNSIFEIVSYKYNDIVYIKMCDHVLNGINTHLSTYHKTPKSLLQLRGVLNTIYSQLEQLKPVFENKQKIYIVDTDEDDVKIGTKKYKVIRDLNKIEELFLKGANTFVIDSYYPINKKCFDNYTIFKIEKDQIRIYDRILNKFTPGGYVE